MSITKSLVAPAVLVATCTTAASAQYTYTDAVAGAGGNSGPASEFGPSNGGDGLWGLRTDNGTNGTIYESATNESTEVISTTITGLTAGVEYDVNAHFYDNSNPASPWAIQAGFAADDLTLYASAPEFALYGGAATPSPLASTFTYTGAGPRFVSGDALQYAAVLGRVTSVDGSITVFFDDVDASSRPAGVNDARTWYDGVSVQAVPEPASMALLGLGSVALLGRRRR